MRKKWTRRRVLWSVAGGVSASFGGVRVLSSKNLATRVSSLGLQINQASSFVYGTAFYRPPDPPASQRRSILKEIAHTYKFNTVRIFTSWAYCNPAPHSFDFGEIDEILGYCDELGLKVLMGVMLEDAPYWLEALHPESRYVNANDTPRRLGGAPNNVSAGAPGLCLDWAPVRSAAERYIREMVKVVKSHSSLHAYDCWNEPHNEPTGHWLVNSPFDISKSLYCYCERTKAEFRKWLKNKYSEIGHLNEAWARRYVKWTHIDPPRRLGVYVDWLDWLRFIIDRNAAELRFRTEQIRTMDSTTLLECHIGLQPAVDSSMAVLGVNPWQLTETVDIWGISYFPGLIKDTWWAAARMDLTRSQAGNKPFWMTEFQGGFAGGSLSRRHNLRPRDIRVGNWLAIALGAKGILYWTYFPGTMSAESGGFALAAPDGSGTERTQEAAEDRSVISTCEGLLKGYSPRPEVALLFDQDTALLTFAMLGGEDMSAYSFRGYYKALWSCDLLVDFIEAKDIQPGAYKAIFAPWHIMAKRDTCESLRRFVEGGGTLILQTGFGMHDERARYSAVIPPYGYDDIFGYREGEGFFMDVRDGSAGNVTANIMGSDKTKRNVSPSERVYAEGYLRFTEPASVTVSAHTFLTPVTALPGADVIARYESTPVATRKRLGRGQVYYIGTNLGGAVNAGDLQGIHLIRALLAGIVVPQVTADTVRPRLIEGASQGLLVVFNEGSTDETVSIKVPPRYRSATDLYSNVKQNIEAQFVLMTVPFEGVTVLLLE